MSTKYIFLLSYGLVLVAYMTLTLSMPLVGLSLPGTGYSSIAFEHGVSILFIMFSLSAILLSSYSDMVGAFYVLRFAQPCSILGLVLLGLSHSALMMYIGFFILGIGTGCYSSIARLLIAKYSATPLQLKNGFSYFSIIIMSAPLAAIHLMLAYMLCYWRYAYFTMAGIEFILMLFVLNMLSTQQTSSSNISWNNLVQGYLFCIKKPMFTINMLSVGVTTALIINVLFGHAHQLFVLQYHLSKHMFSMLMLALTLIYILGIIIFRLLPTNVPYIFIRFVATLSMLIACVLFCNSHTQDMIIFSSCLLCLSVGILSPLTTTTGMAVINKNHGAGAALFTFSFALLSGIWSYIHALLFIHTQAFMSLVLIFSTICMLVFLLGAYCIGLSSRDYLHC